jgi:two-component system, NarL family, sensor histidine kinase DegS
MSYDPSKFGGPHPSGGRGDPGARAQGYQMAQDGAHGSAPRQPGDAGRAPAPSYAEPRAAAGGGPFGGDSELLTESKEEYDHVGRELDEIRMLIKQSASELEKLTQRKVLAAARVREMEEKIETFSRQELRRSYQEASEAEMRAFMMGEQREKLQEKERVLDRYQQYLRRAIEALASATLDRGPAPARWNEPSQRAKPGTGGPREGKIAALARVIQAQEDVRQRVAQRLHDGPAQSLANVVLTAEICEKLVQSDPQRAQGELGNLKGLVNSTLQDTRKFIFELRPMTLDDLGLVPTLRRYVTDVGAKYQVQVNLVAPQGDQRLPKAMEVPIFRVAQEALANAIQHGRATQVRVTLAQPPEGVVLVVEDNGAGFDVEQALAKAAAHETVGIASMQERAEMLGGWLRIESARGHGTRVELSATG